jgi:hypothetical protein
VYLLCLSSSCVSYVSSFYALSIFEFLIVPSVFSNIYLPNFTNFRLFRLTKKIVFNFTPTFKNDYFIIIFLLVQSFSFRIVLLLFHGIQILPMNVSR